MIINIRRGIFETNSSSVHTITMRKGEGLTTRENEKEKYGYDIEDGVLHLYDEDLEFGWGYDKVYSFKQKLGYVIAHKFGSNYLGDYDSINKDFEEFVESTLKPIIQKVYPDFKCIELHSDSITPYGYVDHQSNYELPNFLKSSTLEDFLLNTQYYIIISNDNMSDEQFEYYMNMIGDN